jgi:hypothetical protein
MEILDTFSSQIWILGKYVILFALLLYIIFSLVVIRQVSLMNKTLDVNFEKPVALFSYLHFLLALGVFIFAFLVL